MPYNQRGRYATYLPKQENLQGFPTAGYESVFTGSRTLLSGLTEYQRMLFPYVIHPTKETRKKEPNEQGFQPSGVGSAPNMLRQNTSLGFASNNMMSQRSIPHTRCFSYDPSRNKIEDKESFDGGFGDQFSKRFDDPPKLPDLHEQVHSREALELLEYPETLGPPMPPNPFSITEETLQVVGLLPSTGNLLFASPRMPTPVPQLNEQPVPAEECMPMPLPSTYTPYHPHGEMSADQPDLYSAEDHGSPEVNQPAVQPSQSIPLSSTYTSYQPCEETSVIQPDLYSAEDHGSLEVNQPTIQPGQAMPLPSTYTLYPSREETVDQPDLYSAEDHGSPDVDRPAIQPSQATLHDEQSSADTARDRSSHSPSAITAADSDPSRFQSPSEPPPVPLMRMSQEQADEIGRVIDEGIQSAYRMGILRSNFHITKSLQLELESNETIAWNRVLGLQGQDDATGQENIETMKEKIRRRMKQWYDDVLEIMPTDELLENTRRHRLPGAETGQKRGKRKHGLCDGSNTATSTNRDKKTGKEMETNVKTEMERKETKKKKKETPDAVQATAKRGGKSRPRGARGTASNRGVGAASTGLGDTRPRTRIYSHGGTDFTSQLCSDGVWRIVNVQKKTEPGGPAAEAVRAVAAGNDESGGAA
ncbi:hypothetical protein E4U42_004544 [Claviceps africana]|uniref:Uncharacterized protein n=1 Tax=Claviceps africana TaxID=83212 RepID=A0A8K0J579_9HYPO|nr:hypothetical protein E4U42_004544 [Claviceps africana]